MAEEVPKRRPDEIFEAFEQEERLAFEGAQLIEKTAHRWDPIIAEEDDAHRRGWRLHLTGPTGPIELSYWGYRDSDVEGYRVATGELEGSISFEDTRARCDFSEQDLSNLDDTLESAVLPLSS